MFWQNCVGTSSLNRPLQFAEYILEQWYDIMELFYLSDSFITYGSTQARHDGDDKLGVVTDVEGSMLRLLLYQI